MNWAGPDTLTAAVVNSIAMWLAIWTAMWIDRRWGEPPTWLHPVVAMGAYLARLGPMLTRLPPAAALVAGMLAWSLGALTVAAVAQTLDAALGALLRQRLGDAIPAAMLHGIGLGLLLKPMLSWRMLHDEVLSVERGLSGSLHEGQQRLSRLVSRDVSVLDEAAVRESAIESLAENLNDSLVAPLFWFALAGLPGAALYRFANTADAMWGYRGRYEWAGKWAARVDDLLSWVPARITSLLLCLAARSWPGWRAMRHEAAVTPSPNGGWPMGTMALLLDVSLRKPGVYALHASARPPLAGDTALALRWAGVAADLAASLGMLLCLIPMLAFKGGAA